MWEWKTKQHSAKKSATEKTGRKALTEESKTCTTCIPLVFQRDKERKIRRGKGREGGEGGTGRKVGRERE